MTKNFVFCMTTNYHSTVQHNRQHPHQTPQTLSLLRKNSSIQTPKQTYQLDTLDMLHYASQYHYGRQLF